MNWEEYVVDHVSTNTKDETDQLIERIGKDYGYFNYKGWPKAYRQTTNKMYAFLYQKVNRKIKKINKA